MAAKRADIVRAIRLTYSSLESHLDACIAPEHKNKCCIEAVGRPPFHVRCCKEYGEIIKTLTDCL